jgi:hypothetical protein
LSGEKQRTYFVENCVLSKGVDLSSQPGAEMTVIAAVAWVLIFFEAVLFQDWDAYR